MKNKAARSKTSPFDFETLLRLDDQIADATSALKKAAAIYMDVMDDCKFFDVIKSHDDFQCFIHDHERIANKGKAVNDYLYEAIDILEKMDLYNDNAIQLVRQQEG